MSKTKYTLDTCVWEITRKCNFNCAYCGTKAGKSNPNELGLQQCLDIAEQLADIGCRRVVLIGGEVFLKNGWETIVKRLVDTGIDTSIITNGSLINDKSIKDLKETGIKHICFSIDGTSEVHNKYRMKGSFETAVNAIKFCKSEGFVVTVVSTLNKESVKTLDAFYEVLSMLKIDAWQLQACSPFGNAADKLYLVPSKADLQKVCEFVAQKKNDSVFQIAAADNIGYFTNLEDEIRGIKTKCFTGCSAGLNVIGIDSLGNVRGCESLYDDEFIEGNLTECNLKDIWLSETAFVYNRCFNEDFLTGACKECNARKICVGGCRSFNYFYHGNMYESPMCLKNCN